METGIICNSGIGDFLFNLYALPSIVDKVKQTDLIFYIKNLDNLCLGRTQVVCKLVEDLFNNSEFNVSVRLYDSRFDRPAIIDAALQECSYVFSPWSGEMALDPTWLKPASWTVLFDMLNIKPSKTRYASTVFCHLHSNARGPERNLSGMYKDLLVQSLERKFSTEEVAIFTWDDPYVYPFPTLRGEEPFNIITQMPWERIGETFYVGVDSWFTALLGPSCNSVVWSTPEWKLNLQHLSTSTRILSSRMAVYTPEEPDKIVQEILGL